MKVEATEDNLRLIPDGFGEALGFADIEEDAQMLSWPVALLLEPDDRVDPATVWFMGERTLVSDSFLNPEVKALVESQRAKLALLKRVILALRETGAEEGACGGYWVDDQYGVDWLKHAVEDRPLLVFKDACWTTRALTASSVADLVTEISARGRSRC